MNHRIRFRLYDPSDRQRFLTLLEAVYGEAHGAKTSAWRYLDHPLTSATISLAEIDGRVVGAQPSYEIAVQVNGRDARGAVLLDVMTHPAYRRRGVFAGVVEHLRLSCREQGIRVLLTTPNQAAARGFETFSAWRPLGELSPLVLPVDTVGLLAGTAGWRRLLAPLSAPRRDLGGAGGGRESLPDDIQVSEDLPDSVTTLLRRFARVAPSMIVRTPEFLRWRFRPSLGRRYRFVVDHSGGTARGLAVTGTGTLLGRRILFLVELIAAVPDAGTVSRLLHAARHLAREAEAAAILTYLPPHSPLLRALRSAGLWRVPRFLRPRPYVVWMASHLEGAQRERGLEFGTWHLTLADSDLA
ncbi:MAG: GNAT family N-acetyltransferase [Gemmatimonadota bacterium]